MKKCVCVFTCVGVFPCGSYRCSSVFAILLSNNSGNRLRLRHQPAAVPLLKLTGETCVHIRTHALTHIYKSVAKYHSSLF